MMTLLQEVSTRDAWWIGGYPPGTPEVQDTVDGSVQNFRTPKGATTWDVSETL